MFRWIVRRAIAEGSLRFRTTYAEAAAGAGYAVPRLNCRENRRQAREQRVSTVYRALCSLQAAGLVRFHGVKRDNGQWRCLSVGLTPAAYGPCAPFGRSRRRPRRRPGHRISFSRRSGTSPPVATAKSVPESGSVRAHAREGPPEQAGGEGLRQFSAALALLQPEVRPEGPRPWPNDRFDLTDQETVELVELFEEEFGIPAMFSYRRHGPILRRILERFDRFTGFAGERSGYTAAGRRFRHGAGFLHARELIRKAGRRHRLGNPNDPRRLHSLPYLLPKLDQHSKRRRREWKRTYGKDTGCRRTTDTKGSPASPQT